MEPKIPPRLTIFCGLIGPPLFAAVLTTLTFLNVEFLRGLGWHPLYAPTFDWPSGLALGPQGWLMTATFVVCGLMMSTFALGLREWLPPGMPARTGTTLLALAGLALAGLAFTTDPTIRSTPATWHGRLHDASFVLLGLTLLPAMLSLARAFWADPRWSRLAVYTAATAALSLPAFVLKGIAFYVFLGGVLSWSTVLAWNLRRLVGQAPSWADTGKVPSITQH